MHFKANDLLAQAVRQKEVVRVASVCDAHRYIVSPNAITLTHPCSCGRVRVRWCVYVCVGAEAAAVVEGARVSADGPRIQTRLHTGHRALE